MKFDSISLSFYIYYRIYYISILYIIKENNIKKKQKIYNYNKKRKNFNNLIKIKRNKKGNKKKEGLFSSLIFCDVTQ